MTTKKTSKFVGSAGFFLLKLIYHLEMRIPPKIYFPLIMRLTKKFKMSKKRCSKYHRLVAELNAFKLSCELTNVWQYRVLDFLKVKRCDDLKQTKMIDCLMDYIIKINIKKFLYFFKKTGIPLPNSKLQCLTYNVRWIIICVDVLIIHSGYLSCIQHPMDTSYRQIL